MKIIIDAMGGDNAPLEIVKGAIEAQKELGVELVLVGGGEELLRCFQSLGLGNLPDGVSIVNASQVVTMEDDPARACRDKPDSSMTVALNLLRDGAGDAVVSAGNTGALLSGATLIVRRLRGIRRAALSPTVPNALGGQSILLDVGANVDCTEEYLIQFAFMGEAYARYVLGVEKPKVGLLNIGAEETKGGRLQKQVYALLKQFGEEGKINFIGNVEASEVLSGKADVVVSDGYSGNVMLKAMEGIASFLLRELKDIFYASGKNKLAALMLKKDLGALKQKISVGGSIMLGISKPVVKAHGASKAADIRGAIEQAAKLAGSGTMEEINRRLADMRLPAAEAEVK